MIIDELKFHSIEQTTVTGTSPLTLLNPIGDDLIEYSITGNIVQDGTPTHENPIEIQSVGELVTEGEHSGKYKIPVTITNGEQNESTDIYLDTPLMKDEVLYSNGTRDVKWRKHVVNIKSTVEAESGNILGISSFTTEQDYGMSSEFVFCNIAPNGGSTIVGSCYLNEKNICFVGTSTDTLETLQEKYNDAIVYYRLKTPTTETVTLPNISTPKTETPQLSIDTTIKPTNVSITYNKNETKIIDEVVFHKNGVSTSIDTLEFNGNYIWNKITRIVLKHTAGTFKASAEGTGIKWKYKEQEVTSGSCNFTIDESDNNVYLLFNKELSKFTCNNDDKLLLDLADLSGKITNTLNLNSCKNITGDLSDLGGKITDTLGLYNCIKITGDLSDLGGKITNTLNLYGCKNITGDLSDLGGKITNYLSLYNCSNITGDLSALGGKITDTLGLYNCIKITGDLSDLGGKITNTLNLNSCKNITGDLSDLNGKITNTLNLNSCKNITGDLSDLGGKITNTLGLYNCIKITGDLSDLGGKITNTLSLYGCKNITGDLSDLNGKITNTLNLSNCSSITGDLSDLGGKITNYLNLSNCSSITGDLSDLGGKITNTLSLYNCKSITGDLADLGGKITNTLGLSNCSNITGIYSGQSYPKTIYLSNTGLSASDMDSTLINFANSSVSNGTFAANSMTRTSASDDAVATLTERGWSVKGLTKVET